MTIRQANKELYWAWKAMKQRCQNPKCQAYRNYGERGINVCSDWQEFIPFYNWAISNGYEKGLELDRIDNNGDYTPENCHWDTRKNNLNNRRVTIYLTANGETKSRTEWEESLNLPSGILKAWVIVHGLEYAENRLENIIENGYIQKDYGYSHRRPIINIDTNERYESVREASRATGINSCAISTAMNHRGGQTSKGRFIWADE